MKSWKDGETDTHREIGFVRPTWQLIEKPCTAVKKEKSQNESCFDTNWVSSAMDILMLDCACVKLFFDYFETSL